MARKPLNDELDAELEDSFPASDPPSLTEPAGDARRKQPPIPRRTKRPPRPKP